MSVLVKAIEGIVQIDQVSLRWVAGRRAPLIDRLMRGLSRSGDWQTWTVLIIVAFLAGGQYRALAFQVTPKLLFTLALCFAIKAISKRPRPSEAMQDFSSLLKNPDPYSFPSAHTACAWVVCVSLGSLLGFAWPVWILYASAIGYSRIHVGAHYPLDVFIGTCIGTAIATLV